MRRLLSTSCAALAGVISIGMTTLARASDACAEFTWSIDQERALFARSPRVLAGGKALAAAPTLTPNTLYELQLMRWSEVSFPVTPAGHHSTSSGTYGGLARVRVPTPGIWRISLSEPDWVDILGNGAVLPPKSFQGRHGCSAPHKIMVYELPAAGSVTLQVSAAEHSVVRIAVTQEPAQP